LLSFDHGSVIKNYSLVDNPNKARGEKIAPLGEGGSGVVFLAAQTLHEGVFIHRALKFFMYEDAVADLTPHRYSGPISKQDFLNEILNVSSFSHENLIKVTDAGIYVTGTQEIPFIVTEYIDGPTLKQVLETPLGSANQSVAEIQNTILIKPVTILNFLIEICTGLKHLHQRAFAHCDIAPKNVFLKMNERNTPVIGDLGVGRNLAGKPTPVRVVGSRKYMSPEALRLLDQEIDWFKFSSLQPHWDLYSFAKTGLELAEFVQNNQPDPVPWLHPLITALTECETNQRYATADSLLERLSFLLPIHREIAAVPELSSSLAGKARMLIPVEPLVTSDRIRRLIRHPAVLRLARVPQLTSANQVFPGGNHSRYEHSLGVMETTRRYLIALLDQEEFLEHLTTEKIETALICALLSSITRFPFSSIIHEIKGKHREKLAVFSRGTMLEQIFQMKNRRGQTIPDLLALHFPIVHIECVKNILIGNTREFNNEDQLIHSLLNCSLDARVVDFVRRDSLHTGLVQGDAFDTDELLPHLTILNHRLALRITGVAIAEQIISLRYWLFSRVYWNRPNRSFVAMVRHLIMELSDHDDFLSQMWDKTFRSSEHELLAFFQGEAEKVGRKDLSDLVSLIHRDAQSLFKIALEVSPIEDAQLNVACRRISGKDHNELKTLASDVEGAIRGLLDKTTTTGEITPVLIDIPNEPDANKLGDDIVVIRADGSTESLLNMSGIIKGVNDSFINYLKRLRVLIHPEVFPDDHHRQNQIGEVIKTFLIKNIR